MDAGLATQLVTVGATLGGVVLTLVANAMLERRRSRDTQRLETLRLAAEHTKWLRDERMRAYAGFSLAGEEVLQFLRVELQPLLAPGGESHRAEVDARWQGLRTDLRKAYNQVSLFGAEEPRTVALRQWRIARNSGNDILRDLAAGTDDDFAERIKAAASQLGTEGDNFLQACRADLQGA